MAVEKTEKLERTELDITKLMPNPLNPNEMSEQQFNMLCDNIEKVGLTDPILVRPHPTEKDMYEIVGGHHRWEVAKLYDYKKVPVTIIKDPTFTNDDAAFQAVRHNIIHGKMSPQKFAKLFESLSEERSEQAVAELFGFVDEDEFRKMVKATQKALPKELQQQFKEASKELKTIDDLAKLLNQLFAQHGDTLPYGYMIFDYGGKDSIWLRMGKSDINSMQALGARCMAEGRALDTVVAGLFEEFLAQKNDSIVAAIIANAPKVEIPEGTELPTLDFLDQ